MQSNRVRNSLFLTATVLLGALANMHGLTRMAANRKFKGQMTPLGRIRTGKRFRRGTVGAFGKAGRKSPFRGVCGVPAFG